MTATKCYACKSGTLEEIIIDEPQVFSNVLEFRAPMKIQKCSECEEWAVTGNDLMEWEHKIVEQIINYHSIPFAAMEMNKQVYREMMTFVRKTYGIPLKVYMWLTTYEDTLFAGEHDIITEEK